MGERPDDPGSLSSSSGVFLFQEMNSIFEFFGIEAKNVYRGFSWEGDREDLPDKTLISETNFFVNEESGCFERQCCGPNRSLTFNFFDGMDHGGYKFATVDKSFSIQGCCIFRPEFTVKNGDGEPIGRIEDPFACCVLNQKIYNASDELLYTAGGSVCQLGICCPCAGDVVFDLTDTEDNKVGEIRKVFGGCGELLLGLTKFGLSFPDDADYDTRVLLLATVMGIEMQYFEQPKNNNNGGA